VIYLLDTDTLTHLAARHPRVIQHFHAAKGSEVVTSIVTKVEMLRGRHDFLLKAASSDELLRAQSLLQTTEIFLSSIVVVPFDRAAAGRFDHLVRLKGLKKIGRGDLLIACIVLAHAATLVTRNLRHFQRVPGLLLDNWVD